MTAPCPWALPALSVSFPAHWLGSRQIYQGGSLRAAVERDLDDKAVVVHVKDGNDRLVGPIRMRHSSSSSSLPSYIHQSAAQHELND